MVNFHNFNKTIPKKPLLMISTILFPIAGASLMAKDSYDKDPEKFKQNVLAIHDTVKNDIGSSIKSSSKLFAGIMDKLFLPLILGGGLVVVLIVFKK